MTAEQLQAELEGLVRRNGISADELAELKAKAAAICRNIGI